MRNVNLVHEQGRANLHGKVMLNYFRIEPDAINYLSQLRFEKYKREHQDTYAQKNI